MSGTSNGPKGDLVLVGEITAPFGIRGEVKMRALMDAPDTLASLSEVLLRFEEGRTPQRRRVTQVRPHKNQVVLSVEGVTDMNGAEGLRGAQVLIRRAELPALGPDAYYEDDLVGLHVVTESDRDLGVITMVHFNPAANDVYETPVAMIPVIRDVIVSIDVAGGRMIVRDVVGLRKDE